MMIIAANAMQIAQKMLNIYFVPYNNSLKSDINTCTNTTL